MPCPSISHNKDREKLASPFREAIFPLSFCFSTILFVICSCNFEGHGVPCPPVSGKEYPVGNVPPERFQNQETASGTQGRSGLVRSALEKLSLFSPTFPVRQKHGAGISLSADSDSEGCSPSKNTSPAALSWSSLFGQTVLKSFCFCTTRFVFRRKAGTRRAVSAGLPRSFPAKKSTPTEVRVLFSLYHVRWRFPAHRRALCRGCR